MVEAAIEEYKGHMSTVPLTLFANHSEKHLRSYPAALLIHFHCYPLFRILVLVSHYVPS
jgi:hypothetical protein